jgi:hypothetical protein
MVRHTPRPPRAAPAVAAPREGHPGPRPFEGTLTSDAELARHRRPHCRHYGECLDVTVRAGWDGFSCAACPLRNEAPATGGSAGFAHERRGNPLGG